MNQLFTSPSALPKIVLAPMEGITDVVMRDILTSLGGIDLCVTEFVRVTERLLPPHLFYKYAPELTENGRTKAQVPVFVQLLGGNPNCMADNAALATELGALGIDLNFGCPAKTVNRHDGGAVLLKTPERIYGIIKTVRKTVPAPTPVTAKIRLGYDSTTLKTEIALAVQEAQATWLTIHARTKMDAYKPPAHWEQIAEIKEHVSIPIIANGEVWTLEDYLLCQTRSSCDSIMLGRGALSHPFLPQLIARHQKPTLTPSQDSTWPKACLLLQKLFMSTRDQKNAHTGINRSKQWLRFLMRQFPEAGVLFEKAKVLHDENAFMTLLQTEMQKSPSSF